MKGPSWSEDQLREAVDRERSWRGVVRALGLRSTSSIGTVKRHARRLGLDTSHFAGGRRWSDHELETALVECNTWREVAQRLGLKADSRTGLRLRGYAVRMGLDITHMTDRPDPHPSIETDYGPAQLSELRTAACSIAAAWFALRGFPVAYPSEPQAYDLLVTTTEGIQRVQVKTTTYTTKNGSWLVGIGHRPYSLDKTASKDPYDPEDIDFFVVVNGTGDLYVIPVAAVAGFTGIYLSAYETYRVGDVSSLLN